MTASTWTSVEAEQAILGALLLDPACFDQVADLIRPELFATAEHRAVAGEMLELLRAGKPPDAVLVTQRLQDRKAQVPAELVFGLERGVGVAGNVRHYVETLHELWAGREARRIAIELLRTEGPVRGPELLARFAEQLSAVETRRGLPARRLSEVMVQRLDRREDLQKHPEKLAATILPTGLQALDAITGGFRVGHLVTIAARPGIGKTALVSAISDNLAARGVPTGIFVLEDYADAFADRALARRARLGSHLMRDGASWDRGHWDRASAAVHEQVDRPVYLDDAHGRTIEDITGAMRRMAREHGIRCFILDNLAEVLVDGPDRGEERLDRALGRISKSYRDAANAVGAAAVLLVHLNRDLEKSGGRPPRLSDIKNSGELEDASHQVWLLSRPEGNTTLVVDVAKNRNGPTGEVELAWSPTTMTVGNREAA